MLDWIWPNRGEGWGDLNSCKITIVTSRRKNHDHLSQNRPYSVKYLYLSQDKIMWITLHYTLVEPYVLRETCFHSSVSIIRYFLPNPGRILPALTERGKIKNFPHSGFNPQPPDLHSNALPTELSQHSVASLSLHGLYKVMLYWFQK